MKSRAMALLAPRTLEMRELSVPATPPPGGAIIRVLANGICGSDWDVYAGKLATPGGRPAPFPMVLGHEPLGRIVAIDPLAEHNWGVTVGDRIAVESKVPCRICKQCQLGRAYLCRSPAIYGLVPISAEPGLWGGMADYMMVLGNSTVFKVPENLTDEDAVLFNPFGNAFHWVIEAGRVGVGDTVLILGGGQRGLACAVAAREAGASKVILTGLTRDAHKLALAGEFGADHVIDVQQADTVAAVQEIVGPQGIDVVIDTVPEATPPILHAIELLRKGGTLVTAGVRGHPIDGFPLERLRSKQLHMVGVSGTTGWAVENALRVLSKGGYPFARLHTHRLGLPEAEKAIRILGNEVDAGEVIHIVIQPELG